MTMLLDLSEFQISGDHFWSRVHKGASSECWEWSGALNTTGYGVYHVKTPADRYERTGKLTTHVPAHRVAYMLGNGGLDHNLLVCHHCDNRKCCNPSHLFQGSHQDNMDDMRAKRALKRTT